MTLETVNLLAGWIGTLLGFITGAFLGIFFHDENWLGGYASWPRRMIRLGHISLHGLALINFAFAFTVLYLQLKNSIFSPSVLFIAAAVSMPLCCFISAFYPRLKVFFAIPVTCLVAASGMVLYLGWIQ